MGKLELNQKPMYYLNADNNISADLFMKANTFAFAASYAGMTLEQIADWYPKSIEVDTIIDYLIQEHQFDIIENIFAYMDNPTLANDDIAAKLGLLDFCTYADWLSHRVCFMMYAGTDTWMLLNNEDKPTRYQRINNTEYKISDYLEYITELEGGDKRYITKYEFEKFLNDSLTNKNHESLYDMDYSVDSLFFALFQHGEEYGYDFDKIVDEVLVKDEQSGVNLSIANDFIKYYDFLEDNCQGKSNILSKENVIYHFFEKASIEHFKELARKQKEAELEKIKLAVKEHQEKLKQEKLKETQLNQADTKSSVDLGNDDLIIPDLKNKSSNKTDLNNTNQQIDSKQVDANQADTNLEDIKQVDANLKDIKQADTNSSTASLNNAKQPDSKQSITNSKHRQVRQVGVKRVKSKNNRQNNSDLKKIDSEHDNLKHVKSTDTESTTKLKYAYKKDFNLNNHQTAYAYRTDINLNYIKPKKSKKKRLQKKQNQKVKEERIKQSYACLNNDLSSNNLNNSGLSDSQSKGVEQNALNQTDAKSNQINTNITQAMRNKFKNKHLKHFRDSQNKIKSVY